MTECTIAPREAEANTTQARPGGETTHEPDRYLTPVVDIYETERGLSVVADLPGVTEDAINISVEKDILTIKAHAPSPGDREYASREFETPGYFRQFRLGNKIDQGSIKADYRHGVLRLTLPFAAESKPRVIEVKIA